MNDASSPEFQRAFVATMYLFERRNDELVSALSNECAAAVELAKALGHPERASRAQVLARELARIAKALDDRWLR
jgi:hypothetical protein